MADVGETIRDVILRITGDGDDARRELERLALDLTKFGNKKAEANAKIDTAKAKADLKALETQFERIDGRDLSATAKVQLGKAMAELAMLQAKLDEIDGRDVEIDIELQKDLEDRLQALGGKAAGFADKLGDLERNSVSTGEAIADTNVNFFNMNTRLGSLVKALPGLIPLIVGFMAQIVALGASAITAAGGLGSLLIALGGAFTSGLAIAGAAVLRFKETMDEAGTPAHKIVEIAGEIGEAMSGMSKAADPILEAIADNLGGVLDVLDKVRPAFFSLGKAAGEAVGWMVKALTSSDMAEAIAKLLELSGPVMKPLAQIFVRFGRILLNIANAAMPFLTEALQGLARVLGEAVNATSDLGATRKVVGGMIEHLRSWFNLLVQIAGVFGELTRIAAPFGKEMVDSLAKGAESLKEWLSSSEGTERVSQFFKDVLPLAEEVAAMIGELGIIFLQFGQLMAPVWRPIVAGIRDVLGVVRFLLELMNKIPAPVREALGTLIMLVGGLGKFKVAGWGVLAVIRLVVAALGIAGGAFSGLWDIIKNGVSAIPGFIKDKLGAAADAVGNAGESIKNAASSTWSAIRDTAGNVWGSIKDAIGSAVDGAREKVAGAVDGMREKAAGAWDSIRSKAASVFESIRSAIKDKITGARDALANAVDGMRDKAGAVWDTVRTKAATIFDAVRDAIKEKIVGAKDALANAVDGMREKAAAAWDLVREKAGSVFTGVKEAITEKIGDAKNAVGTAVDGMKEKIENAASAFYKGGVALIDNLIDGFMSKVDYLYDKVKGAVDKVTGLLPGSEPKDPNSPLRNLARRGRAIIENLTRGVVEAGPDLVGAMSRELAGVAAAGPMALSPAGGAVGVNAAVRRSAEWSARQPGLPAANGAGAVARTIIEQLIVQPLADGGSPDPDVLAAQLSMAIRTRSG